MTDPSPTAGRWLTLFVATRLAATVVAAALLVVQPASAGTALLVVGVAYGSVTAIAAVRWLTARGRLAVWIADAVVVLMLVLVAGEWRSPFYPLALTALVFPATTLPARRAAVFGAAFTGGYLAIALATGIDWSMLRTTARLESFSTHLLMPVLIVVALAYAARLVAGLERERGRAESLAVEAERNRIARELHDSAKQRIHAAHLVLSSAERRIEEGSLAAAVGQAMAELRAATADMETSLSELRTPLDGRGLGEAVRARARELEVAGTPIEVAGDASPELPTFVAVHAFRVASEAMTNAIRHAGAERVWVSLSDEDGRLSVDVADDGAGMPDQPRPGSHGLSSMRARAESLGGELFVGSAGAGRGTVVRLVVPIEGALAA